MPRLPTRSRRVPIGWVGRGGASYVGFFFFFAGLRAIEVGVGGRLAAEPAGVARPLRLPPTEPRRRRWPSPPASSPRQRVVSREGSRTCSPAHMNACNVGWSAEGPPRPAWPLLPPSRLGDSMARRRSPLVPHACPAGQGPAPAFFSLVHPPLHPLSPRRPRPLALCCLRRVYPVATACTPRLRGADGQERGLGASMPAGRVARPGQHRERAHGGAATPGGV